MLAPAQPRFEQPVQPRTAPLIAPRQPLINPYHDRYSGPHLAGHAKHPGSSDQANTSSPPPPPDQQSQRRSLTVAMRGGPQMCGGEQINRSVALRRHARRRRTSTTCSSASISRFSMCCPAQRLRRDLQRLKLRVCASRHSCTSKLQSCCARQINRCGFRGDGHVRRRASCPSRSSRGCLTRGTRSCRDPPAISLGRAPAGYQQRTSVRSAPGPRDASWKMVAQRRSPWAEARVGRLRCLAFSHSRHVLRCSPDRSAC